MWAHQRCAGCRPSTATNPGWRWPAAGKDSITPARSSPQWLVTSGPAGSWCARSATASARSSAPTHTWDCADRSPRCSSSRLPERPPLLERAPGGLERRDERALARGERVAGMPRRGRELGEQTTGHGDIVQLAEDVLQRFEALDIGLRRGASKRWGEEVAGIAQPLHVDAQAVAPLRIAPVDVTRFAQRLSVQALERCLGEVDKRTLGAPAALVHPAHRTQQESLQLG